MAESVQIARPTPAERLLALYSRLTPTERGGYRLARLARRLRPRSRWRGVFRTPWGFTLGLDLAVYPDCCMASGLYELDTARCLARLLQPGDHFVDGGANVGYFTLLAAQLVGPGGRVDAFEPQPDNCRRLCENLARNGLADRVHVHPVALSDQPGHATIHFYLTGKGGVNHGSSTLFARPGLPTRAARVDMVRLGDVLAGSTPRLIKLDIEGAEPLAIRGMGSLLQGPQPPALIVEYNPDTARCAGFTGRASIDALLAAQPRYAVFRIGRRLTPVEPSDARLARLRQGNLLLRCV